MEWIIFAIACGFVATVLNAGCASPQHLIKDCNPVISANSAEKIEGGAEIKGEPTGECVGKSATLWWQNW